MNLLSQQPSLHAGVPLKPFPEVPLPVPAVVIPTSDLDLNSVDSTTKLSMCSICNFLVQRVHMFLCNLLSVHEYTTLLYQYMSICKFIRLVFAES